MSRMLNCPLSRSLYFTPPMACCNTQGRINPMVGPGALVNDGAHFEDNTVVIAYKNTGYKNISVIRTISPGNRFSSYSFVLEEYRL